MRPNQNFINSLTIRDGLPIYDTPLYVMGGTSSMTLRKISSTGSFMWGQSFTGSTYLPTCLAVDRYDNSYIADSTIQWIAKFDPDGNRIYTKYMGLSINTLECSGDRIYSLDCRDLSFNFDSIVTNQPTYPIDSTSSYGDFYSCGQSTGGASASVSRFKKDGTISWESFPPDGLTRDLKGVGYDKNTGDVWVGGTTESSFNILKYDANGNLSATYSSGNEVINALKVDVSGNVILAAGAAIRKYSATFSLIWSYPTTFNPSDIKCDDAGNIYWCGSREYGKLNSSGSLQWSSILASGINLTKCGIPYR